MVLTEELQMQNLNDEVDLIIDGDDDGYDSEVIDDGDDDND